MASDRIRQNEMMGDRGPGYPKGRRGATGSDLGGAPQFGGPTFGVEEEAPRRSRLLPLVIAFFALAAFAGIVWYAYEWGVGQVQPEHLPVVQAPSGPIKEKPAEPGGLEVPYTDSAVLNRTAESGQAPRVERLLPPPEEPAEVPAAPAPEPKPEPQQAPAAGPAEPAPEAAPGTLAEAPAEPDLPELPRPEAEAAGPGEPMASPAASEAEGPEAETAPAPAPDAVGGQEAPEGQTPVEQVAERPVPAPVEPAPVEPAPVDSKPVDSTPVAPSGEQPAGSPQQDQPAAQAPQKSAPAKPAGELGSVPAGSWVIQLAAFRSEEAARGAWSRIQSGHSELLGSMPLLLERADLGDRGIYYRIQTGPIPNKATALDLCAQLKAAGQDCITKQK